ncbi:TPA: hypothetical protein ACF2DD_002066 [Clostridium perfringens]
MREENRELIIDWSRFKSNTKGKMLEKAKQGYIEFCKMLNEADFELVSDYINTSKKVKLVYRLDNNISLNIKPNSFKTTIYKSIVVLKNNLTKNNDMFVKFIDLTNKGNLIVKIKTFDGGEVDIDMASYDHWNKSRKDFYNKLKEVSGYTMDCYIGVMTKMIIYIDGVRLNPISPNVFKSKIYTSIINFKNNLKENNDKFIGFVRLNEGGNLIAKITTFDEVVIYIDINNYNRFNNSRMDFYSKLKEINGYTSNGYVGTDIKINISIDDVKLNPMPANSFKLSTYKAIVNFKNKLKENGDEFVKFVGLNNKSSLIAQIKTFDDNKTIIDINNYNRWNKSRKDTYYYCSSKGYKILSPYISSEEKILVDFSCGHNSHWITPSSLKRNCGCPICSESKGEKFIRLYLESNNINFVQEYRFEDCRYKSSLRFDFYISKYNLCIEYDGKQHFEAFEYFGGEESFKNIQKRDKIKNKFCEENNIRLIRIPYWKLDNIEKILDEEFDKLKGVIKRVC